MLRVWTSPPSKVPAYSMSAPVVGNATTGTCGSTFTTRQPDAHWFWCKGEGRDSLCGGHWLMETQLTLFVTVRPHLPAT